MATKFLSRLRVATQHALRVKIAGTRHRADRGNSGRDTRALFSRLASPKVELVRANAGWQPKPPLIRIEIMASGPFEGLRGIRSAVNRLQHGLVTAVRRGTLELRLTEIRPTCRHSTAWSSASQDPGASTTAWQCFVDAFADEAKRSRTLFAQAFRESLRNHVNHVVVFGDRFDDGLLFLCSAIRTFRRQGVRVSTFCLGDDFNTRNKYRFLAVGTGGVFMPLCGQHDIEAALPMIAAFACGDLPTLPAASRRRLPVTNL